jgi:Protein of unknown function (DUF3761)
VGGVDELPWLAFMPVCSIWRRKETLACHDFPGDYTNSDGQLVHRPKCVTEHQPGETAICRDGSQAFRVPPAPPCPKDGVGRPLMAE